MVGIPLFTFTRPPYKSKLLMESVKKKPQLLAAGFVVCGEGGIRTPGTLIEYASLANWWIKPLSHLSGAQVLLSRRRRIKRDKSNQNMEIFAKKNVPLKGTFLC